VEPILAFVERDRPFLAICVGMQLLFDYSLEFGRHAGLGLITGHVERIPASDDGGSRKVPHVGWSTLHVPVTRSGWESTLLEGAAPAHSAAYFVHSYNCIPDDPSLCLADTDYDGFKVTAAVVKNNITGFQCHPEKSGELGLKIFGNFLNM
jgi:glutamine amidotransferase